MSRVGPSHLPSTSVYVGRAAEQAAETKRRKYDFLAQRLHFVSVSVETSGVWEPGGLRFVKEVGTRVAAVTG